MRRHQHAHAIIQQRRLVAGGGGLPLHHGVGLHTGRFHLIGQRHANRAIIIHFEHGGHAILQESGGVPEQILGQRDLVVVFHIHEHQIVALGIEELEVLGVEAHALYRVLAAEANVGLAAIDQVLHLDLHEGAALARLGVLRLGNFPDALLIFENIAGTNIDAADLHGMDLQ